MRVKNLLFCFLSLVALSCSDVNFTKAPLIVSEVLRQNGKPAKLDILVVIDNSRSMTKAQKDMAHKMDSFIEQLKEVDWQLSVTNTDVSSKRYGMKGELIEFDETGLKVLKPYTPFRKEKFLHAIIRPETPRPCNTNCPSSDERGLEAVFLAIEKSRNKTRNLFRNGVEFTVVLLSNEDEGSNGLAGTGRSLVTPEKVLRKFHKVFSQKTLQFHSLIVLPGDKRCREEQGSTANYGSFAFELSQKTNGLSKSICSKNYSKELEEIGKKPRNPVKVFHLKKEPFLPSLKVTVQPQQENSQFIIDGKKLIFEVAPPLNSKIIVSYRPLDSIPPDKPEQPDSLSTISHKD